MFEKIEDNMANRTRFFVLSDFKNIRSNCDKTSILALTAHRPGNLESPAKRSRYFSSFSKVLGVILLGLKSKVLINTTAKSNKIKQPKPIKT